MDISGTLDETARPELRYVRNPKWGWDTVLALHADAHDKAHRAGTEGTHVNAPSLEREVLNKTAKDFSDEAFLRRVAEEARRGCRLDEADPLALDDDIRRVEKGLANRLELAADAGEKALLQKIRDTQSSLDSLRGQKAGWQSGPR